MQLQVRIPWVQRRYFFFFFFTDKTKEYMANLGVISPDHQPQMIQPCPAQRVGTKSCSLQGSSPGQEGKMYMNEHCIPSSPDLYGECSLRGLMRQM